MASSRARPLIICPFTERTRPAQAQTSPLRWEAVSAPGDGGSTDVGQYDDQSKSAKTTDGIVQRTAACGHYQT